MRVIFVFCLIGLYWRGGEAIRGGSLTRIAQNPHLVSISVNENFACAGSLLTLDWVITVGSCLIEVPIEAITVRAGSMKTHSLGQTANVESVLIHPMFNWYTQDYDLALIKLAQPFVGGPKVKPIEIAKDETAANETLTLVGWGENTIAVYGELRKLDVALITVDSCRASYKYDIISPRMVCSWVDANNSPCWNDFGDPLKNKWGRLVGMYTWGRVCSEYPSVYTYLYPYREWIATAVPDL
ncbi:Trypsin-5 [Nesidiocoris tenuis]|uniref:Trypsin-5 n=1 Tax=Nesidiocoris tenuis TaxID=355587 RepID=A0ABN7B8K0_9HEMI|nr:Trypsin-5 [Nesidiocoris tenuis]